MNNSIINTTNNMEESTPQENAEMVVEMYGDLLTDKAIEKLYKRFGLKKTR